MTLSPFYSGNFQFVLHLYWEANSFYPRGLILREESFPNSKSEWDRGVWVPDALTLDHLNDFKPILFWEFSIWFTFILGGQFFLPQRPNIEKGEFSQFQKRKRQGVWGPMTFEVDDLQPFRWNAFWRWGIFPIFSDTSREGHDGAHWRSDEPR